MQMKLSTLNVIAGILSGMKLNKISDKEVKTTLVNDYLHIRRFVKDAEEQRKELVDKFQSDWGDELSAVEEFRRDGKPIEGHKAYLDAEADANKAVQGIFAAEVDASPKAVPMDAFLSACGGEELTLEQIAVLEEGGIVVE